MKATIIINPFSGKRRAPKVACLAKQISDEFGVVLSIKMIQGPGHGVELARAAVRGGAERVLCAGGDGSLNAVATGLLGTRVPLGIVPMGSGNGYSRSLGLPQKPDEALRVAFTGAIQSVDVGYLNGLPFLGMAGIGFDARVADLFNRSQNRGFGGYLRVILKEIINIKPLRVRVTANGRITESKVLMLVFCNTREFGNGARISPTSIPNDGMVELKLVHKPIWASLPFAFLDLYIGRANRSKHIATIKATEAMVLQEGTMAHLDGEPVTLGHDICFRLVKGQLGVVIP